ncbi:MAG TPA: helix-turn-helix transcriptional regulator [Steroidobacteraceae bacterium]|jgi:transcriptional regulator with XRE-family HTH domain|nr:helix-turn-helix transcriptional regulator [Steroidobacteraceae bacterium]
MEPLHREIGQRIRKARLAIGMDQVELARRLGYRTGASVYKYERGMHGLSAREFIIVATVLGRSLDWIISGVEKDTDPTLSTEGFENLLTRLHATQQEQLLLERYLRDNQHHRMTAAYVTAWLGCYRAHASPRRAGNAAVAQAAREAAIRETSSAAQAQPKRTRARIQARRRQDQAPPTK